MKKYFAVALLILFILANGCLQTQTVQSNNLSETVSVELNVVGDQNQVILNQTIQVQKGTNAFDALNQNIQIEYQDYSFGKFITGINGLKADSSKEYWAFYVNNQYSSAGVQDFIIQEPVKLEFRLEKISS